MNKKLRLLIFVMSGVVVALLLGVLLISVVGNLTSVEVYSFKLCATTTSEINESDVNKTYTYYLSDTATENIVEPDFMNKTGTNDTRIRYYFELSDADEAEHVATVLEEDDKYKLQLNKIGQITIDVYSGTYVGGTTQKGSTFYGKYKIKVLKELYTINHVLSTEEENLMPITVQQRTSGNDADVVFSSSNRNVANVVRRNGVYYIAFYSEGKATITAYAASNSGVCDKIFVNVFSNEPNNLMFVDDNGQKITSATIFTSNVGDGKYYEIKYKLIAKGEKSQQSSDAENVNCQNVRIADYSRVPTLMNMTEEFYYTNHGNKHFSESAFDEIILDKDSNTIKIRKEIVRGSNTSFEDSVGYITLQTYITDENGQEVSSGTYTIFVNIIKTIPVALELEVSNEPKFSNTRKVLYASDGYVPLAWEGVENIIRPENLYFSFNGEVRTLYYKVWNVWNNGDREIVTDSLTTAINNQTIYEGSINIVERSDGEDGVYHVLRLTNDFIADINATSASIKESEITALTITHNYGTTVTLKFKCLDIANNNIAELYNEADGKYTYNYWDDRFASNKTITDKEGNIIGFIA